MSVYEVRSPLNSFYVYRFTFYFMFRLTLNFHIWVFCVQIIWSTIFVSAIDLTLLL